jgi:RNA polymerase sigma factor (sigma-70 family)
MENKELNVKLSHNDVYFEMDKSQDAGDKQPEFLAKKRAHIYENQTLIAELLKQQDTSAIAYLYDAYGSALYGVVLRIVHTKEIAEQVLQDTFLKVWHKGASFDASKGRLYTWLLNIARNTAIDATRNSHFHNRKNTDTIDNLTHTLDGECLNPDTVGLREIVKKLDEKYILLIDLIYFNQYTQQEAADATGLPLGTVKTRVRHALLELRKAFIC